MVLQLEEYRKRREPTPLDRGLDYADDATAALYGAARELRAAGWDAQAADYLRLYRAAVATRRTLPGGLEASA